MAGFHSIRARFIASGHPRRPNCNSANLCVKLSLVNYGLQGATLGLGVQFSGFLAISTKYYRYGLVQFRGGFR